MTTSEQSSLANSIHFEAMFRFRYTLLDSSTTSNRTNTVCNRNECCLPMKTVLKSSYAILDNNLYDMHRRVAREQAIENIKCYQKNCRKVCDSADSRAI